MANRIFAAGRDLLEREVDGTRYRLIGIGVSCLAPAKHADPVGLLDTNAARDDAAERALDRWRERFGRRAVVKGLAFDGEDER